MWSSIWIIVGGAHVPLLSVLPFAEPGETVATSHYRTPPH